MHTVTFRKGVHPRYHKSSTSARPTESAPLPDLVSLPLLQHLGAPSKPTKGRGDAVSVGEVVCEAGGRISARVHSPVAGTVKRIVQKPLPGGRMCDYMEIEVDKEATAAHEWSKADVDLDALDRETVVSKIAEAGIVGMGGATFPTHIKYSPPSTQPIDTLIVNGAECEPYLTCDHRLMVERPVAIVSAVRILHKAFGFRQIFFGVEENKPDALLAFESALADDPELPARVVPLEVKYPQGAEKMLIYAAAGRIVPAGGLPLDIGVLVSNVATLNAIYEAFYLNKPLIERIVTVTGGGVREPKNLRVPIGTPFDSLVEAAGGVGEATAKVIVGGPMMGVAIPTLDYSVMKGTSGVVFLTERDVPAETPCIKCGTCVRVCPMGLMPLKLAAYAKAGKFEEAKELGVTDCFECGSCAFSCPAKIRIVAWVRYAKNYIRVKGI